MANLILSPMKKLILLLGVLTPLFLVAQDLPFAQDNQISTIVEQMPVFPGGQDSLASFLKNNIKYPEKAKKEKTSGTVYVSFIVNILGEVAQVNLSHGVSPEIDEEALRVVKLIPKWKTPGKQGGKPVNVQMTLPIRFVLPKNETQKAK